MVKWLAMVKVFPLKRFVFLHNILSILELGVHKFISSSERKKRGSEKGEQAWVKVSALEELPLSVTARKIARMLTAN